MPGKMETTKDVLQVAVESGAERIGRIAGVVTGAVGEITTEIGGWCTDVFEMLDAADKAEKDQDEPPE